MSNIAHNMHFFYSHIVETAVVMFLSFEKGDINAFLRITCLIIYMFRSSVCIVHALCMVTVHITCNVDIEVGPDPRQVLPNLTISSQPFTGCEETVCRMI